MDITEPDIMEKKNFWNDAARYGAIVGCVLALSGLLENRILLSGNMKLFVLLVFEFFAVVVLHYYLLHRYTRNRSRMYTADEGFSFGQGYGFVLVVSGFAGIIVGCVQAIYLHLVVGYSTFLDRYLASMSDVLARSGGSSDAVESLFSQVVSQIQASPAPSVLRTFLGGVWGSLFFGLIFGLIIAGVLARAPRPFDAQNEQ